MITGAISELAKLAKALTEKEARKEAEKLAESKKDKNLVKQFDEATTRQNIEIL